MDRVPCKVIELAAYRTPVAAVRPAADRLSEIALLIAEHSWPTVALSASKKNRS